VPARGLLNEQCSGLGHGLRCDWYDIARPDNRIPDRCRGRSTDRFSEGKGRDRGDCSLRRRGWHDWVGSLVVTLS